MSLHQQITGGEAVNGRAIPSGRATRASHRARAGLGHAAGIPIAWIIAAAEAGRNDPDPFFKGDDA